ncbi:MAG: M67 family metallopeptidase [Acidimicrobiales bacterium]
MLVLSHPLYSEILAHCLDGIPLEACGLLGGHPGTSVADPAVVTACYATANAAASARVYSVEPRDLLRADRAVEAAGGELIGVWHSHTHTDAKPSPTDVAEAPDPGWHYVLVSLRDLEPSLRSWRIEGGKIEEEPVVLQS